MSASITRTQVLAFRMAAQQLARAEGCLADTAVLDIGVQDSGTDGALWALANRGVGDEERAGPALARLWGVRGAPHLYRRVDLPLVAAALEPFSEADAGKRIYNAAKPLKQAGISNLAGLDAVAAALRSVVTKPMAKGDVSGRVAALMDAPYLRFCRPCDATHLYEMPFRLAAIRAGLELQADTSPPVLRRIPGFKRASSTSDNLDGVDQRNNVDRVDQRNNFDLVRTYLRLLGPATPKLVAAYLDAPVADVKARWPDDAVEVTLDGETRWTLTADAGDLGAAPPRLTRLLGPFDLFLQGKDRELLVSDPAHAKALWPVLGRPGAVLVDGVIIGLWRPRAAGAKLTVRVDLWAKAAARVRESITDQAERLAAFRGSQLSTVDFG